MINEWFKNIQFAYPWLVGLFALVPVMFYFYQRKQQKSASIKVSSVRFFQQNSVKYRWRHLPFILRLLAVVLLVIALMRPQRRNDRIETIGEGIDIVLCMDVSGSMNSRDIAPTRMEAAKQVAEDFVLNRPVDKIGLVIFSGESYTQVPVTTDKQMLVTQIQSLAARKYLVDGTVIGEGLAMAVDRLTRSDAKSKVIILLTDGKEDPPATRLIDPLTALKIARTAGVKVYTIGMSGLLKNAVTGTEEKIDFLDEKLLQDIAIQTGGEYFRAGDKTALEDIYQRIDKLEKSKVEVYTYRRYQEFFFPFLLGAVGFLFAEIILRTTLFRKVP